MSRRPAPFVHPFTFFVVQQGLERVLEQLVLNRLDRAVYILYWFVGFLDEDIQEALEPDVRRMAALIDNRDNVTPEETRRLVQTVAVLLHKKGYFTAAKSRPPKREAGLTSIAEKLRGIDAT